MQASFPYQIAQGSLGAMNSSNTNTYNTNNNASLNSDSLTNNNNNNSNNSRNRNNNLMHNYSAGVDVAAAYGGKLHGSNSNNNSPAPNLEHQHNMPPPTTAGYAYPGTVGAASPGVPATFQPQFGGSPAPTAAATVGGFTSPYLNINVGTKLFVGQVPAVCTEAQLHPVFAEYGNLLEVHIMREPSGRSKGSAWVRYEREDSARRAIEALHEKCVIPPQTNPLRVQFAAPPRRDSNMYSNNNTNAYGGGMPVGFFPGQQQQQQQQQRPPQQQHSQPSPFPSAAAMPGMYQPGGSNGSAGARPFYNGASSYSITSPHQQQPQQQQQQYYPQQQQQQQQQQRGSAPYTAAPQPSAQQQQYLYGGGVNPAPGGYTYVVPQQQGAQRPAYGGQ